LELSIGEHVSAIAIGEAAIAPAHTSPTASASISIDV
jgi:hypothetical protein